MKRNWDTIRDILTRLEEITETKRILRLKDFPDDRAHEISYHAELLLEAGLIEGQMSKQIGPPVYDFQLIRLTWEGHDFLDAVRSDLIWEKTKKSFLSLGLSMTFDLVKSVASKITNSYIESQVGS